MCNSEQSVAQKQYNIFCKKENIIFYAGENLLTFVKNA